MLLLAVVLLCSPSEAAMMGHCRWLLNHQQEQWEQQQEMAPSVEQVGWEVADQLVVVLVQQN